MDSSFETDFKEDNASVKKFGELNPAAIKLMDRVGGNSHTLSKKIYGSWKILPFVVCIL